MVEKLVEAVVVKKVAAIMFPLPGAEVSGFWQETPTGVPRWREGKPPVLVEVVAGTRSYETFTSAKAQLRVSVTMTVRRNMFPTGAELEAFASPLIDLLEGWQRDIAQVKADFTLTDADGAPLFTPHGATLAGGDVTADAGDSAWTIPLTLTLRGVIK
jgi:hypothetical protein